MLRVLSEKLSKSKAIMHLLTENLQGREHRGMLLRHEKLMEKGWGAVSHARF